MMTSPRFMDDYNRPPSRRLDVLEDRLSHQEKTTSSLIDRAFKIKEDIIDTLNLTHGTWQSEKQARELLQEHIRTITMVVKRLSREIEGLEGQVRGRSSVGVDTSSAVKNLELHHVGSVVDLRGRVARCDASIARLSADMRTLNGSIATVNRQLQETNSAVLEAIRRLDSKMSSISEKVDVTSVDHVTKIHHVKGESSSAVAKLDSKTKGHLEDLKSTIEATRYHNATEREKLAKQFVHQMETIETVRSSKQDQYEERMSERTRRLERRVEILEETVKQEREHYRKAEIEMRRKWEETFEARQAYFDNKLREEMENMRMENRRGFTNVYASIDSTKQIQEGKRKMMGTQLQKEIQDLKKMVVLI